MNGRPQQGAALRRLFLVQLVAMAAMEMSGPFWPLHLRTIGQLTPQQLAWASGIAYAGPMAMAMCLSPWWGRLGDRIGHKPMLLRALFALSMTQLWIGVADSVWLILLARLVQGALAGFIAAAQAYGAGLVERSQRASLMARLQVATAIGSVLGPVAGGCLFDVMGFRAVNLLAALVCFLCGLMAAVALPAADAVSTPPEAPRSGSWRHKMGGLLLGIGMVQAGKMMPQSFFGLYADKVLHASALTTGLCYGATALGLCLAAPYWGRRFQHCSRQQVLRQVEWICWACVAVVGVQALARELPLVLAARLAWGVCLAALLPVFYALLSREAGAAEQGRVLGAGNSAAKAGALLGAGAGGLALAWVPVQHLFWPVAAVYVAAAVGMRLIRSGPRTAAA